jgi:NTP pyrophosphatase (non-canonical NTP hydrolase)
MKVINNNVPAIEILEFRDERNWNIYHTPSNLAKSISIEAAELLELYQWSDEATIIERVKEELADVLIYSITLAERLGLNINSIILEKIRKNGIKYPNKEKSRLK